MLFCRSPENKRASDLVKTRVSLLNKIHRKNRRRTFSPSSFLGIRNDKFISDIINQNKAEELPRKEAKISPVKNQKEPLKIKEKIIPNSKNYTLKLTNQNKIYFPKSVIIKGDVKDYYQSVSAFILPHLKNRPQSLNRFLNGSEGLSFYHKDAGNDSPDLVDKVSVSSESNEKDILYLICNKAEDLAYLNNLGYIDLNPWNSTVDHLENPDWLALDLDPSEKNTFDHVIETALVIKTILDQAKIKACCKTSGSSGIHIYLPLNAKCDFEQVKNFVHILMRKVNQILPDLTILERNIKKRGTEKIYRDYL